MVDRLVERAADTAVERVAGGAKLVGVQEETAVLSSATDGRVRLPNRLVSAGSDVGEGQARDVADRRIGDRAAADESVAFTARNGVAGRRRAEVQASEPQCECRAH